MTPIATRSARATKTVLIVDDEPAIVRMLKDALGMFRHEHGYTVEIACDGVDALAALERHQFDLVLLDMYMPRMSGLELLEEMRRLNVSTPVLMLTGNDDARSAADALSGGIFAYIPKPFDLQHLEHLVSLAVSSRSAA
jgi:DNA-binding NtrC family response regulator